MIEPQGARRLSLVCDPIIGISVIQEQCNGMSRYSIHAGILEELKDKFIKAIEENWDQEEFNRFLSHPLTRIEKYRPQTLEEIVSHEDLNDLLKRSSSTFIVL
ncbi:hypothetical protein Glove_374g22 [Diversispora epigaea]|uniref:Uncharacterized protein n=1 Tax=Diversispora epigaea TaxID=1348612 RepID=A0A397H9K0_9GLOM|nr:hypothetical protein Glove_374g22 [Diversispora epigaea]